MFFIIIFLVTLLLHFFLPVWWALVPAVFLLALFLAKNSRTAFWMAFSASGLAWLILILFKTISNDNLFAGRMAQVLHLSNWVILVLVAVIAGGLLSGLAALAGAETKKIIDRNRAAAVATPPH